MPTTGDEFTTRAGVKCVLGQQVTNLEALDMAAHLKLSVIIPDSNAWRIPRPAIFMINQNGGVLLRLFRAGMFIYIKQPKTKKTTSPS